MGQDKIQSARTKDNDLSLVARIPRAEKTKRQNKFTNNSCYLTDEQCKKEHPKGCREAYLNYRGMVYKTLNIRDPRFDGLRGCTVDEAHWFIFYDPASPWNGLTEGPSIHDAVAYYSDWAKGRGLFGDDPPSVQSLRTAWMHHIKKNSVPQGYAETPTLEEDRAAHHQQPKAAAVADISELKQEESSPYETTDIQHNPDGVDAVLEANKTAKESDNIRWVANMMPLKSKHVDIATAPSSAAVGLLQWARSDPKTFYGQFYVKLLPSQKEFEKENMMQDRGGALDMLATFIEKHNAAND